MKSKWYIGDQAKIDSLITSLDNERTDRYAEATDSSSLQDNWAVRVIDGYTYYMKHVAKRITSILEKDKEATLKLRAADLLMFETFKDTNGPDYGDAGQVDQWRKIHDTQKKHAGEKLQCFYAISRILDFMKENKFNITLT